MVSPPSEPHSEKAHPNSPPQINLAFKAKGPDQDPGTTQPEGNSTHLTFFPRGGHASLAPPLDPPMGMGHMGNGVLGVWGIWAMRPTGGMGYRGMGHMGNRGTGGMGYKGYGPHRQWGTGVWAMGPMGNLLPKYQKDVKLSKRCHVKK